MLRSLLLVLLTAAACRAEEGVWTFDAPPRKMLRERYRFEPNDAWFDHLRLSTLRVGNEWGSAAFVSADGLVATCLHTAFRWMDKASTKERDLFKNAFVARRRSEEVRLPGLELSVLESMEDVTARVQAPVEGKADPTAAAEARRRAILALERESFEKTGLHSEVISLFHGGQFMLHRSRVYNDVRLAFSPEAMVLEFGDHRRLADPRFKLDVALLRVYVDGQPVRPAHFLRWSKDGAAEGELIFQTGIPGVSQRGLSVAELTWLRDEHFPAQIRRIQRELDLLQRWSAGSEERARLVEDALGTAQGWKANRERRLMLLAAPGYLEGKVAAETALRARLAAEPAKFGAALQAFDRPAEAMRLLAASAPRHRLLEQTDAFPCEVFRLARLLLRAGEERTKPDDARLPEFASSARATLERQLQPTESLQPDLERARLAAGLEHLVASLGAKDALVLQVLAGKVPAERAAEIMAQTKLLDPAERRRIFEGGAKEVEAARDPLLELARIVDSAARAARREVEAADELKTQANHALSQARLALDGSRGYPDGTNSLRLTFGPVKSFADFEASIVEPSDFAGAFARSDSERNGRPYVLPASWLKARAQLSLKTTLNFVAAHDSLAGNSGSAMVNRAGEFVGVLAGMVRWGAVGDFSHDERIRGDIGVHSSAILEALEKIYDARALADELRKGK